MPMTAVMVTCAEPDFVGSAWDTAVTVTVAGFGTTAGAVYRPELDIVPTVALPPVTPLTCQVTAVLLVFCTVAVNCCVPPAPTVAATGEIVTLTTAVGVMVTCAEADFVGSAWDTAVTVTMAGFGTTAGAVYRPELDIVPTVALPPVTPLTCQVTAVLLVFCTVAVNCCVPPAPTVADTGEIVTRTTAAGVMVTCAEADFVGSAWDTAVTVTVAGFGTTAGAVYRPELDIVPTVALPPVTPLTCQVTAVLLVFCTVAVNCCVPPAPTVAATGEIVTRTTAVGVMVTCAEADFVGSAWDTAVTVTMAGFGTTVGAVYRPEFDIVPTVALPPVTPLTCQVTAVLLVFCTVAVNCCVPPAPTVAATGEIVTRTGMGVRVVEPAQPKVCNILIATPANPSQYPTRSTVFRLQPRPSVFIAYGGLPGTMSPCRQPCGRLYTIEGGSRCASSTTSLFLRRSCRGELATPRRRSCATSSMISGGTLVSCLAKAVTKAFSQTVLISRATPRE